MANKSDLDALETSLKSDVIHLENRFDGIGERLDTLHSRINAQMKTYTTLMLGALTALTAMFSLIVGFFG